MDLADYLRRQFAYDVWANREVLAAIQAAGPSERSLALMAHIISAERLWLERLRQQPQSSPVWPKISSQQCEAQGAELARSWPVYLKPLTAADVAKTIGYKNSKGEPWTSTIGDILTHVLLHSAYHRGQVASCMRGNGHTPAYTDFIHAVRQGLIS
jgi:uncharacterized damage-inducible protein DinB